MTTPQRRRIYYSDSNLHVQTPHGFIPIGTADRPVYVRTATGWIEYPGGRALKEFTATGWLDAVTSG